MGDSIRTETFQKIKKAGGRLFKNKYVIAVFVLGAVLLLIPGKSEKKQQNAGYQFNGSEPEFSIDEQEAKIAQAFAADWYLEDGDITVSADRWCRRSGGGAYVESRY